MKKRKMMNSSKIIITLTALEEIMETTIRVATTILPHEDTEKVVDSIKNLFPNWKPDNYPKNQNFPTKRTDVEVAGKAESLDIILDIISKNRILDTAFDAMTMYLNNDTTKFYLSRQAAIVGKVSFAIDERPIGGVMKVTLSRQKLGLWLEQETWHEGRDKIPRSVSDELSMDSDGTPKEWFDKRGRPTMNEDYD
tara:strand:+ start:25863 stop:26447 length:585 start_codon:yes stop_codon:yes gene_type:complete